MPPEFTPLAAAPDWRWWIVLYFFLGGIAAGSYFTASLLELFGDERDAGAVRTAHLIAFPLVAICGLLLVVDLGRPERFWHMLFESARAPTPIFKIWSPMSVGSWGLLIFSGFAFFSFVDALLSRHGPRRLHRGTHGLVWAVLGSLAGFFLAGYTGLLLSSTSQPVWTQSTFISALFTASAASTGVAALLLAFGLRRRHEPSAEQKLERFDNGMMVLELVLLVVFVASLGVMARVFQSGLGAIVLWGGVAVLGLVVPLLLHLRTRLLGGSTVLVASVLALIGGFLLRYAVVMLPQGYLG